MRGFLPLLVLALLAGCAAAPPRAPVREAAVDAVTPPAPANATALAPFDTKGTAALSMLGACAPVPGGESCAGVTGDTPGHLSVPRNLTRARLVLTWDAPVAAIASYQVVLGNRSAAGFSPLTLDVPSLAPGNHEVHVFPDGAAGPTPDQEFTWELREG